MSDRSPVAHAPDWPVARLADIAIKIGSGATPAGGEETYLLARSSFALVRSQNVFDRRFDRHGLAFISDDQADKLKGVILQPKDLLLNITGDGITFSRACMVPNEVLPACVNQHVAIIRINKAVADPGYVLSYLTHPTVKSYIESFNAGGSRRAITKGHIESFRIPLPSLPEQHAIAHILGTLDDKIELNRRMNETLEAMASALFKSWFVDFDPVRAKAEGRDPGLPEEVADLFPDSFQQSELGQIPEGWKIGSYGEIVEQLRDQENPLASANALFHHFSIPAFDAGQWPKLERGDSIKSVKSRVPPGVILLSKLNPRIERVWLVDVNINDPAVCSTEFLVLRPRLPYGRSYVYCLTRSTLFRQQVEALVTGTSNSHQRAQAETILAQPAIMPPKSIASEFEKTSLPLLLLTSENRRKTLAISVMRDTLLPKLISGQVQINDAVKCLESIV